MTTPRALVQKAQTQLGVRELGGPNMGIPFERYAITKEEPLPWCARFVRWCCSSIGVPLPGNPWLNASVENLRKELAGRNMLVDAKDTPLPGDLIFLRSRGQSDVGPGHHIGIVETVDETWVTSIDGNWGDAVCRVPRRRADPTIACYGRVVT